jgi:hypothetical protein
MADLKAEPFMNMISVQKIMREREKRKSAFRHFVSVENCSRKNRLFQAFHGYRGQRSKK